MSQNRSASGGVRNLRAMFENKDDAAPPPDRGRSPAGVVGNNSDRPLSRVRTSFIAVDNRNGQSGLRKDAELNSATEAINSATEAISNAFSNAFSNVISNTTISNTISISNSNSNKSSPAGSPNGSPDNTHDMSFSKRRSSFSINEDLNPQAMSDRRESITEEFEARQESSMVTETIPEAAVETPSLEPAPERQLGSSGPLPTTRTIPELTKTSTPVQSTSEPGCPSTLETLDAPARPSISNDPSTKKPRRGSMAVSADEKPTLKPALDADKAGAEKATPKAAPKSSLSAESKTSRSVKSPVPPKTPTSPRRTTTKPTTKPTSSSTADRKLSPRPSTSLRSSPPGAKPKSRSPTRPVKLPSSLTAPTAASVKKTSSTPPVAKASETRPANTASKSGVQRKSSTLKRDSSAKPTARRSSSKPPTSKQSAAEESKPKATTSQGFLERMMRPTAASAQKTHEKSNSPPKRTRSAAKRPGEQNGQRSTGSPERKSKSVSPEKPQKKSTEEQEKQPHEDAVVMQALIDGNPVEEAMEELQVENEQKAEKGVKRSLEKPQISSTKPVQAPAEPPVATPATGIVPSIADSPLKVEVKVSDESKSDKPVDPFQAMKETPSMSEARKGPLSAGEGNALTVAFESGSAIADNEEDLPVPIPHPSKSSMQEPEGASIPEETAAEKENVNKFEA